MIIMLFPSFLYSKQVGVAFIPIMEYNIIIKDVIALLAYMTANEAAAKWNISHRRVLTLCKENRISDVAMLGNMWIIPIDAKKPEDARSLRYIQNGEKAVKPFLKWAGGKSQLLREIENFYPFADGKITKYAEPFVGGGAVLFDIISKYDLEEIYISDINKELMNTYCVVRDDIDELLEMLYKFQEEFIQLDTDNRKEYYLKKRERFNALKVDEKSNDNIEKSAIMIFLNKTCFNGLYRVNRKGLFNVPMGSYKNPLICDEKNLRAVSEKLQNVTIICADYKESINFIDEKTFVYFDPPYRPLTDTASFTSYTENNFDDKKQIELAKFVECVNDKGAKILVSNSDPKNTNLEDNFFDEIYSAYNIQRVEANRMINCQAESRGKIKELLISNF